MDWLEYISAGVVFLITHRVPTIPSVRAHIVNTTGEKGFLIAYSALSLATLSWLIVACGRAPYVELWPTEPWHYWIPNIVMPVVCIIIALAVGTPNPLSFGGGNSDKFDPDRPDLAGVMRHGLLWALALWSGSHIFVNGDLAHLILFGSFCGFALLGMPMIDRRRQRQLGRSYWQRLARATSSWPFQSVVTGRWRPTVPISWRMTGLRVFFGLCLYFGLIMAHADVIGVSPLPIVNIP